MMARASGKVSVIIPNLDGEALLPDCLSSLREQAILETIVVDNGSTDASVTLIEQISPEARIIRNVSNLGFAMACNQGAEQASGEYLLFYNSDVSVPPKGIERLVQALEDDPSAAACQPLLKRPDGSQLDNAGSFFTKTGFLYHVTTDELASVKSAERFSLQGSCLLVRRLAFETVGGFDNSYFAYFEETDLCWRLRLAGWRLIVVNDVVGIHLGGATTTRIFASAWIDYLSFRNRLTTIRKNAGLPLAVRVLPIHVVSCLAVAGAFLVKGKLANTMAIIRAVSWHLRPMPAELRATRREAQSFRQLSDQEALGTVTVPMTFRAARKLLRTYLKRW